MLSVENKTFVLSVIKLNVVELCVVMLSVEASKLDKAEKDVQGKTLCPDHHFITLTRGNIVLTHCP